jgi:hypothetical protein
MGYTVRTPTERYVEWRRFGTEEVVARELYTYKGDELFETINLAAEPAMKSRVEELAAMLPKSPPAKDPNDLPEPAKKKKKS